MNRLRRLIRPAVWLGAAVALALGAGLLGLWQQIDFTIYRQLYLTTTPQPDGRVQLVDVAMPAEARDGRMQGFRERQASALQALARLDPPPRTVLLDIWISSTPEGLDTLAAAVATLQQRGTRVLAAVEPKNRQGALSADFMQQHNARFYSQVVDGFGHTQLDAAGGLLYFRCRLALPSAQGQVLLTALPAVAVPGGDCREQAVVIPLGDDHAFAPLTHRPTADGAGFDPPFARAAMPELVIVGSLAADSDNQLARPGPVLLAWAMSDLLRAGQRVARRPLNHPAAAISLAVAAALTTLLTYRLAFRRLRVNIAPTRWLRLASILVPLALAAATGLLLAGAGLVALDGGPVVPLAMPLAMAATAAGWAWTQARVWISDERLRADLAAPGEERAIAYDVFVSYAHDPPEHQAWVQAQVVAPLAALRRPDGQPLRIFFDTTSIKVGRRWKAEIELALLGTRCVIPVYSARYFERPYCREEIELADQLRIEGRLQMLPVARTIDAIPERYLRKLQYIDARGDAPIGPIGPALCEQVAAVLREPAGARSGGSAGDGPAHHGDGSDPPRDTAARPARPTPG